VSGFAVQNLWLHYKYQPDREYLSTIAYPAIRDVAIFYSDFLERCEVGPQGKVILAPSYSPEHWSMTEDFKYNRNCAFDIAFIQYAMQAAIEAAQVLGRDEELAERLKAQLSRLPDYPATKGPNPIVVDVEGAPPIEYNIAVPTVPVFPGDQITWFSSDAEKRLFLRTLGQIQWNGNNAAMMLSTARTRLSIPNAAEWIRSEFVARMRPNGTLTCNRQPHAFNALGHYAEQFAASMVVSEMLLQSVGDVLRVFPAWPTEKDAGFRNLRAQGGFLVSARQAGGKTQEVRITSTVGGALRMVSPWPAAKVACSKDGLGVPLRMDAHGRITVDTQAGETLLFREAH
jgi:hypothetical protein